MPKFDDRVNYDENNLKPVELKRVANHNSKVEYLNQFNVSSIQNYNLSELARKAYKAFDTEYDENKVEDVLKENITEHLAHKMIHEANDSNLSTEVELNNEAEINADASQDQNIIDDTNASITAQKEASEELTEADEALNTLANLKFNEIVKQDKEQAQKYLDEVKKAHPSDYDKYIEELRKTKYYQKCLEKWRKYYADIKEKCLETTKQEIEAHAKSEASENAENTVVEIENSNAEENEIAPTQEKLDRVEQTKQEKIDVEKLDTKKFIPKSVSANMILDKNLNKTVQEILIDKLYESLDESSDMYRKLSSKLGAEQFNTKEVMINFRSLLADALQQSHNKLYPKRTGVYAPAYKNMQNNIANHTGNMTVSSAADLFIKSMNDKIIPELAETLTLRLQEILLTNDIENFNLKKEDVTKLLERITDKAELYNSVTNAAANSNGKLDIANKLLAERKVMADCVKNNQQYVYDISKFDKMRDELEENYRNNQNNISDSEYDILDNAINEVAGVAFKAAMQQELTKDEVANIKNVYEKVKEIKNISKTEKSLNESTSKKLFDKDDGIQLIFDYMLAGYIESVSKANIRGNLNTFEYTKNDVNHSIKIAEEMLEKNNNLHPIVTSNLLDSYSIELQNQRNKVKDEDERVKLTDLINKFAEMSITIEEDETLQETGELTDDDKRQITVHQMSAVELINDYIDLTSETKKSKVSLKVDIETLNLGD